MCKRAISRPDLQNPDSDCVTIQFFRNFSKEYSTLGQKLRLNRDKTPIVCVFLLFSLHFDHRTLIVTQSESGLCGRYHYSQEKANFDKTANIGYILSTILDFSLFYQSIIFIKRYCLMRNLTESIPLVIPEHSPITHNPTKNYGLTQKIESSVYPSDNRNPSIFMFVFLFSISVVLELFNNKKRNALECSIFWAFLLSVYYDNAIVGEDI